MRFLAARTNTTDEFEVIVKPLETERCIIQPQGRPWAFVTVHAGATKRDPDQPLSHFSSLIISSEAFWGSDRSIAGWKRQLATMLAKTGSRQEA